MAKKSQPIKLQVKARRPIQSARRSGARSTHGVNIMEFCKAFNAQTRAWRRLPCRCHHRVQRSFVHLRDQDAARVDPAEKAVGIRAAVAVRIPERSAPSIVLSWKTSPR